MFNGINQIADRLMDPLESLLEQFSLQAEVFFTGTLCENAHFPPGDPRGHLHIVKSGTVTLQRYAHAPLEIKGPSVVFIRDQKGHTLEPHIASDPTIMCSFLKTDNMIVNPIVKALPDFWEMNLNIAPSLEPLINVLLYELNREGVGQKIALTRLVEYVFIVILRHLFETGFIKTGLLAALNDTRLSKVLLAIHDHPEKNWTVESLAELAGMSRARFAVIFRERLGQTALDYVTHWRMMLARQMLSNGLSVKSIAPKVGYQSSAAFSRTFTKLHGMAPKAIAKPAR